MAIEVIISCRF